MVDDRSDRATGRQLNGRKGRKVRWSSVLIGGLLAVLAACGGDEVGEEAPDAEAGDGGAATTAAESESSDGNEGGGAVVVDPAPPGQAIASVDGLNVTMDIIGQEGCEITDTEISFFFRSSEDAIDPETDAIIGSAFMGDNGWEVSFSYNLGHPTPGEGTTYSTEGGSLAVDGNSLTYSGEWEIPFGGGSVGDGTLSVNCG